MPIDEGWNLVNDALHKTGKMKYEDFPLNDLLQPAIQRASEEGIDFSDPTGEFNYSPVTTGPTGDVYCCAEIAIWQISLMFVEYLAGMLREKAEKHCYDKEMNQSHGRPCPNSKKVHLEMLKRYADDLEKLLNQIRAIG